MFMCSFYWKELVLHVVEMQVIRKTGVAVAKDWRTSRMMFFQGGDYVTPPTGTSFVLAIV